MKPILSAVTFTLVSCAAPRDEEITLGGSEPVTLQELLDRARELLDVDRFVLDVAPETLKQEIPLWRAVRVPRAELPAWFDAVLQSRGCVHAVLEDDAVAVHLIGEVPGGGAGIGWYRALATRVSPAYARGLGDGDPLVTTWYTPEHMAARDGMNTLQSYLTDWFGLDLQYLAHANTILVTGRAGAVASCLRLLDQVDAAAAARHAQGDAGS